MTKTNKKISVDEYLKEENKQTSSVWNGEELCGKSELKLLSTPELVQEYISKYELYPESELKLLSTPELVQEYISKYRLCGKSELKLLSKKQKIITQK